MSADKKKSVSVIAIWYTVSNFLVQGLAILTTPLFSRILTKAEYGEFSNFITWESVITVILSVQLSATIPRARRDYPNQENGYMASMIFFSNMLTLLSMFVLEIIPMPFINVMDMEQKYIRLLLISIFFSPAFTLWQTNLRMEMRYKSFVLFSVISAVSGTICPLVMVVIMENKYEARLYGYIIPKIILNAGMWMYIWFKAKKVSKKYILYAVPIAIPLMLNALAGNVLASSDRIMIKNIKGAEQTAMYTMGYSCASIISILWLSLNQAWAPWLYNKLGEKEYGEIRSKSKIYIGIFVVFFVLILLIVPEIVFILGGENYQEVRYAIPAVIVGLFYQMIYGLYVNVETYMKKTMSIVWGTTLAAIINVLLNIIFIPKWGYIAASYTTLFGYFVMAVFHYFNVYRFKEYRKVYDTKFVFISMFVVFMYHILCMALYTSDIFRYGLIILLFMIVVVLAFWKRKIIRQIYINVLGRG